MTLCDHQDVDCHCDIIFVSWEKPQRKRKKKNMTTTSEHGHGHGAIDHPLGHRIEEHEFVRIGQHFVTPERTLKAEMLHELGEASTAAASARRRLQQQQQDKEWTAEEGDGRKLMSSAEVQPNDCLLGEEARDAGDEILKDELHLEAAIVDQDDGCEENRAVESGGHQCNCPRCHHSETEMVITNEQVLEAIKEVVAEAIRSANGDKKVRNDKTQVKVEEEKKDEKEMKMEVSPQMEDQKFSDETQANHLLETQDQVEEEAIHSSEPCLGCARRAAQKLQCSMTQDPTVSLRGAELLFSSYIEEKETIISDFDRALETIDSELDFFFGQLAEDYDSAAGPETRLALGELDEVAGVIFDALEVDGPVLGGVINDAVEVAIDKAADCVVEVVDFTVGFTKWLVEGVRITAQGMVFVVDTLGQSAGVLIEEGKGISTDLFGIEWPAPPLSPSFPKIKDETANDCFKASTEEDVTIEAEPDTQLEAAVPYLTPVDVLTLVVKGLLGGSNQSADVSISQWPAKTGLTEWPLSGGPRSNLKQQSAE